MKSDAPRFASFPVSPENVPTKHRAIFFVILRRPVIPSCATGLHARHAATP